MAGPVRPVIVLFGSSIVQYSFRDGGWGANLADKYSRQADVVLRGYEGWNSRQALQVLDIIFPMNAMVHPSLVIVYFGGNDSCRPLPDGTSPHVPLPEYMVNMRRIALHIRNLSETTRVIFLSCPPVNENIQNQNEPALRRNDISRDYSNACIKMCNELSREDQSFRVIDLFNAIQQHHDWANTCFLDDGVHLSPVGSGIVAAEIVRTINEAGWEPSLSLRDLPTEFQEVSYPIQHIEQ